MKVTGTIAALAAVVLCGATVAGPVTAAVPRSARTQAAHQVRLPGAHTVQLPSQCTGYKTYGVPMVDRLQKGKTYSAEIVTNRGSIIVTLLPKVAPITVQSFIFLAQHHYFDGVKFHRIIPGFVIQGGDPTGTGYCGPGYEFKDEPVKQPYVRGTLAMANAGANTNGSQFFIVLANNTSLNQEPNYTIFGQVAHGISAVDRIASVPLGGPQGGEQSVPLQKVYMKSVRIIVR